MLFLEMLVRTIVPIQKSFFSSPHGCLLISLWLGHNFQACQFDNHNDKQKQRTFTMTFRPVLSAFLALVASTASVVDALGSDYIDTVPLTVYEETDLSPQNMDFDQINNRVRLTTLLAT